MKGKIKIKSFKHYVVDETYRGHLNENTQSVVMDNSISRNPAHNNKKKITYFVTENTKLFEGSTTVAIFRVTNKKPPLLTGAA